MCTGGGAGPSGSGGCRGRGAGLWASRGEIRKLLQRTAVGGGWARNPSGLSRCSLNSAGTLLPAGLCTGWLCPLPAVLFPGYPPLPGHVAGRLEGFVEWPLLTTIRHCHPPGTWHLRSHSLPVDPLGQHRGRHRPSLRLALRTQPEPFLSFRLWFAGWPPIRWAVICVCVPLTGPARSNGR